MKITKEQVEHLSPEQQEALASMELQRAKKRQRLLDEVGGRPSLTKWLPGFFPILFFCLLFGSALFTGNDSFTGDARLLSSGGYAPLCIIGIAMIPGFFIQVQVALQNRRLDALVDMLEEDRKESGPDA